VKRDRYDRSFTEPMYTPAELAALTKTSLRTVRRWIANGELEVIRFGRSVRIEQSAYAVLLRRRRGK
jgi:excisionase family DNA binding protein